MEGLAGRLPLSGCSVNHILEWLEDGLRIALIDAAVPTEVSRFVASRHMHDAQYFRLVLAHAMNELRRNGSYVGSEVETVLVRQASDWAIEAQVRLRPQTLRAKGG